MGPSLDSVAERGPVGLDARAAEQRDKSEVFAEDRCHVLVDDLCKLLLDG